MAAATDLIRLDTAWVSPDRLGAQHGIDRETLRELYEAPVSEAIEWLWTQPDAPGEARGWLSLPDNDALWQDVIRFGEDSQGRYDDLLILGIGGSALGGETLLNALLPPLWNLLPAEKRNGRPRYHFVDNVDADVLSNLVEMLDWRRTLVCIITKSGSTAETLSAWMLVADRMRQYWQSQGEDADIRMRENVVAITDPKAGLLRQMVGDLGLVHSFEVPPEVGGRFSVFSAVGLVPAAVCGVDISQLREGMRAIRPALQASELSDNPAAMAALLHYHAMTRLECPIHVLMPYSGRLNKLSAWFVQIWAESLGKRENLTGDIVHVGPTPLGAVGVTDQHSVLQLLNDGPFDKLISFVEVSCLDTTLTIPDTFGQYEGLNYLANRSFNDLMAAEFAGTRQALAENGRPTLTWTLPKLNANTLAQLLYALEVQTALTGRFLDINPFDQPGVELGKRYTKALMQNRDSGAVATAT